MSVGRELGLACDSNRERALGLGHDLEHAVSDVLGARGVESKVKIIVHNKQGLLLDEELAQVSRHDTSLANNSIHDVRLDQILLSLNTLR